MNFQVGAFFTLLKEGLRRALTFTIFDIDLIVANTFLLFTVEVFVVGQAAIDAGLNVELAHLELVVNIVDPQGASGAVVCIGAARIVLTAFEVGQQIVV